MPEKNRQGRENTIRQRLNGRIRPTRQRPHALRRLANTGIARKDVSDVDGHGVMIRLASSCFRESSAHPSTAASTSEMPCFGIPSTAATFNSERFGPKDSASNRISGATTSVTNTYPSGIAESIRKLLSRASERGGEPLPPFMRTD